jgi:hypothetical protein
MKADQTEPRADSVVGWRSASRIAITTSQKGQLDLLPDIPFANE